MDANKLSAEAKAKMKNDARMMERKGSGKHERKNPSSKKKLRKFEFTVEILNKAKNIENISPDGARPEPHLFFSPLFVCELRYAKKGGRGSNVVFSIGHGQSCVWDGKEGQVQREGRGEGVGPPKKTYKAGQTKPI